MNSYEWPTPKPTHKPARYWGLEWGTSEVVWIRMNDLHLNQPINLPVTGV